MLRFTAWTKQYLVDGVITRYLGASVAVALALVLNKLLLRLSVRDPVALIYLAAVAVSCWYGRKGAAFLAFSLSTICLLRHFLGVDHHWTQVARYDLPIICLYVVFASWIYYFTNSRRHLEAALRNNGDALDAAVKSRTIELFRTNAEYEAVRAAAPLGLVLLGPGRIVQLCNPAYERMMGYSCRELLGREAPLPEEERKAWNVLEDMLKTGQPIVEHEATRIRRNGSRFSATIWLTPLQDQFGSYSILIGFILDSTKRKEDEAKLKISLEENGKLLKENRALQERLQCENISLQERNLALQSEIADIQRVRFEKIIGESPAIRRTLSKIEQVAATDLTVLITGETGTGKELIAQAIHENSKRAGMPFRAFNCGARPPTLMAAELFGHEKGAFTGAERLRLGQFELASGGTLFLDEIAEMPVETQAMLLRVLEEHDFERLGGTKTIASDVRIIAATNRDLHTAMQKGEFRQDLFFRLNGFRIEMPPLRERKDDIPLLVRHFVRVAAEEHGKNIRNIEKRVMDVLLNYSWPGNVRELRNVIDTSVIISPGEDFILDKELLFGAPAVRSELGGTFEEKVVQYECSLIESALTETRGRISGPSGAAKLLGVPASTLSAKLKVHRIDVAKFKVRED